MSDSQTFQIRFVGVDPNTPDAATVSTVARQTIAGLQHTGADLRPAYTGDKGAAEVFQWILLAATVATPLLTLTDLALKNAQLLSEIMTLRAAQGTAPATPAVTVVIQVAGAEARIDTSEALSDEELLARLIATLPAQMDPADVVIEVQVPPTPPRDI